MSRPSPAELCEQVLDLVGDRAEAIVSASSGESALTRFATSMIHQNVAEDDSSVFLKVIVDGRYASASTTQTDRDALQRLADRTVEAARLRPADPEWPGLAEPAPAPSVEHWDDDTADASPDERELRVRQARALEVETIGARRIRRKEITRARCPDDVVLVNAVAADSDRTD
jgi:predicted Zn-dependent protease